MSGFEAELFKDEPVEPAFSDCGNCEGCPLVTNAENLVAVHRRSNSLILKGLTDGSLERSAQLAHEELVSRGVDATYEEAYGDLLKDVGAKMNRSDKAIETNIAERDKFIALCGGVVRAVVVADELDGGKTEHTFTSCGSPSLPLIEGELYSRAVITSRRRL